MSFANLKIWQWILIGVFVGAALSYSQLYDIGGKRLDPSESSVGTGGKLSALALTGLVTRNPTPKGYAWIADLTLYPPVGNSMFATGKRLEMLPNSRDKGVYKPFEVISDIPFKLESKDPDPASPSFTLKDHLDLMRKSSPELSSRVQYRYAWWREPPAVWGLWGGGSVLLIGVAWPLLLGMIVSPEARLAAKVEQDSKMSRWGKGKPEAAAVNGKRVTQGDMDSLADVTARFEAGLKGSGHAHTTEAAEIQTELSAATIKKLNAAPVEPVAEAKDEGPKEYGGEFYPVAKTGEAKKQ